MKLPFPTTLYIGVAGTVGKGATGLEEVVVLVVDVECDPVVVLLVVTVRKLCEAVREVLVVLDV